MINVSTVYSAAATTTNKNKALNSSLKTTNHDYRNILPSVFKGEWSNVSNEIIILLFICLTIASLLSLLALYCLLQCLWRKYIDKNNDQMFENNSLTATIEGRRKFKRSFSLMPSESITLNRQSLAKFDHKKRRKLFSLSPTTTLKTMTTLRKRNNQNQHNHNLTNVEITLKMPNDRMRQLKREQTPIMRMIQLTNANRRQLINLGYNDVELESIGYYRVNIFKGQSYRQQLSDWNDSNLTSGFNVTSENSKQQQPFIHRKNRSEREITYTSSEFESDHSIKDKKL